MGYKNMADDWEYETNTVLSAPATFVVEGDEFQANVTVLGSLDYDTQIGGSTTVPHLQVDSIKVL